jgi:hypothetical protein
MAARLDLGKVVAGAFLVPWWQRKAFARALAVPVALIFAYSLLWQEYAAPRLGAAGGWLGAALYGLLFTFFAVRCHRLVLLDAQAVAAEWRPRWTMRETRFFMWVAGLWLFGMLGFLVVLTIAANAWTALGGDLRAGHEWLEAAAKLVLLYFLGRLCLLFPATAVDREPPPGWRWSWGLTRGNGWRLFIVVGALPMLFALLVDLVYRSEATTLEWLLVSGLAIVLFAVEIAAVSLSYRELTA